MLKGPTAFPFFIELIKILIFSGVTAAIKNESVLEDERLSKSDFLVQGIFHSFYVQYLQIHC